MDADGLLVGLGGFGVVGWWCVFLFGWGFMHALSVPTWMIHVSSVVEWIGAIWLIWVYGELTDNRGWKFFALAMLPALVSAMCACTWHFFDNPLSLDWLVTLQAAMTVVNNCTVCAAAWWLWRTEKQGEMLGCGVPDEEGKGKLEGEG